MARKKEPEKPANHERWLVSYGDFITLLFAVFVTLYAMQLLPLWTGRAVNFVTSGSGWPFFHSPRGKSGISHGLNC